MVNKPVCSGYLSKLSHAGASTWKKKYFVLLPDGTFSCSVKKGTAPKQLFYLNADSAFSPIPDEELRGEKGFYVTVNAKDIICVKSSKTSEIDSWEAAIKSVLQGIDARAQSRKRMSVMDIYNKMVEVPGRRTRGYYMKVGKKTNAKDFFVNANTFEFFKTEDDCSNGNKPVGKASLALLV